MCGDAQLLTFSSGSFTCANDYKTQTEKNITQGADQYTQTPSFDDQGNLVEDYRFLCLSTQYFRGLRDTASGLYAVCELNLLTEIDKNAVECPFGHVADGFDEGTALTSRQIVCKKALDYAFNSLIGKEEKLLSKLSIKDTCKTGYVLIKGDETTTDWHCGVNNISIEQEKEYFCSQNPTYKICENNFDFVSYFNIPTQFLAIGSTGDSDGGSTGKGAVYIFEKKLNGALTQSLKISNNGGGEGKLNVDLDGNDYFGTSVSYSTDVLVVGAKEDDDGKSGAGAAYIFHKDSNKEWSQTLKISNNGGGTGKLNVDLDKYDFFGASVSYSNKTLAVGTYGDDDGDNHQGAVYIFEQKPNKEWSQTLKISENGGGIEKLDVNLDFLDFFGNSVSYSNSTLAVGAYGDDDGGDHKGAVYIFEKDSNGDWSQTLKISDNGGGTGKLDVNLDTFDYFGISVSYSDNKLLVGAPSDDDGGTGRGAVYLFERDSNGVWSQTLKISDNAGGPGKVSVSLDDYDLFGSSASHLGNTISVGSYRNDGGEEKGAVYLFEKDLSGVWSQTFKISNNEGGDGLANVDLNSFAKFGSSVSLSDI